ncbi:hypothetical protein M011DRAFT_476200 [Sporormia fimetaria CBS 119925]|uniref:CCHC-type domain-containing protein n=1 Tax=Sporormia fimetaria CBS 119925 TaxID=1340428 RepID=A0A6A6VI94_9PLEO|nr:hypothetical protein M011DRAFT_476200 [Sporormia fimetaria CBS 119925]
MPSMMLPDPEAESKATVKTEVKREGGDDDALEGVATRPVQIKREEIGRTLADVEPEDVEGSVDISRFMPPNRAIIQNGSLTQHSSFNHSSEASFQFQLNMKCIYCCGTRGHDCHAKRWEDCRRKCPYCDDRSHVGKLCPRLWCTQDWWKRYLGRVPTVAEVPSLCPTPEQIERVILQASSQKPHRGTKRKAGEAFGAHQPTDGMVEESLSQVAEGKKPAEASKTIEQLKSEIELLKKELAMRPMKPTEDTKLHASVTCTECSAPLDIHLAVWAAKGA